MQLAPVLGVAPGQRQFAQQQLVKDRAQGIDVATPVAAAAMGANLLRRQVGPVAERGALFADQLRRACAKAAQAHPLRALQAHMFGLQCAMQHIAFVGPGQGPCGVHRDVEKRLQGRRAFAQQVGNGVAGRVHQQRALGRAHERRGDYRPLRVQL
ncbi:hypothetical protein D3C80_1416980 [compost metagenome]